MDQTKKEQQLLFLRRLTWWMPALTFAVVAAILTVLNAFTNAGLVNNLVQALVAAIIVGILVVGAYFGYKYMLDRGMNV